MLRGYIKSFNEARQFGFIKPKDGTADVFFHASALQGPVVRGADVVYVVEATDRGPRATSVVIEL